MVDCRPVALEVGSSMGTSVGEGVSGNWNLELGVGRTRSVVLNLLWYLWVGYVCFVDGLLEPCLLDVVQAVDVGIRLSIDRLVGWFVHCVFISILSLNASWTLK